MPPAIPRRQPIEDRFTGLLLQDQGDWLIAVSEVPGIQTAENGSWIVRYGIRYLGKPHLSIAPALVAVDYGQMITGEEAWQFLRKRSNLYPRAEVFGFRNDGRDDMTYVRNLDFVQPVDVMIFSSETDTTPHARPCAIIASEQEALSLPARLPEFLPRYASLQEWQGQRAIR